MKMPETSMNMELPREVTSHTVETHGLYSMPRYSYEWPTWEVCLWAVLVGPVAGLGAAGFRRFIKFVEGDVVGIS